MRRATRLRLLAGIAVTGMVLTACGSTSPTTGGSSSPSNAPASSSAPAPAASSGSGNGSTGSSAPAPSSGGQSSAPAPSSDNSSAAGPQMTGDKSKVKLGLAYDLGGRGDQSFNDSAARGLDKAKGEGVAVAGELTAQANEPDSAKVGRLNQLVKDGATDIVAVGFAYATPLGEVAPKQPNVHFAIVDDNSLCDPSREGGALPNVDCMTFAEQEGSFLVGVAAALMSKSGKVGFIGGVDVPLIQKFQAGYDAGVKAAKPDVAVTDKYISPAGDFSGFSDPASGEKMAKGMYDDGVDIIYAAAGGSGAGVFKAAKAAGKFGIGVDSDQYNAPSLADVKSVIITSMVKNVDVAVYDFFASAVNGSPLTGNHVYDLKSGGVGFATSGGAIDNIVTQLNDYKQKIISGEIKVPSTTS